MNILKLLKNVLIEMIEEDIDLTSVDRYEDKLTLNKKVSIDSSDINKGIVEINDNNGSVYRSSTEEGIKKVIELLKSNES
ncbi:hypothetical protein [Pseudoalteromonas undina]|uniref:hypothetical protein n=1 Tax=Pseudoalteromonas undina TaxID=43660 RepID=UPI001866C79E|nr:hypothetical protein [Pseudoalteromonas undina]